MTRPISPIDRVSSFHLRAATSELRDFAADGVADAPENRARRHRTMAALPDRVDAGLTDLPIGRPHPFFAFAAGSMTTLLLLALAAVLL